MHLVNWNQDSMSAMKVISGCLVFVLIGLWMVNSGVLVKQVVGFLSIAFFGLGGVVYVFRLLVQQTEKFKHGSGLHLKNDPSSVHVAEVTFDDEEVLECWKRSCPDMERSMQSVSVIKSTDSSDCRSLMVSAGEFFPAEPESMELHNAIVSKLSLLPDVTDVLREDKEAWVVVGDLTCHELVQHASVAVDGFHQSRIAREATE